MKRKNLIIIIILLLISLKLKADEQKTNTHLSYLNYSSFQMQVAEVNIVEEVDTKDGTIEAENRNNVLVEVKLTGLSPEPGLIIYNTSIFSAVIKYRGFYKIVSARAIGVKPEIVPGEKIEVMISDLAASMNNAMSKPGKEELFVYFEIPKEITEFQVQIPSLLNSLAQVKKY